MSDAEALRVIEERRSWIEGERRRQIPQLRLDEREVSESEARVAAREVMGAVADEEAMALQVRYRRLRIGDQRTLWGSCSPSGTLSFNWRLVLAPFAVLDYVVVHELCHLRIADHSRRFWALVEERRPAWREQRAWLHAHGGELLAFRPGD
jgi:predicted metal-dependent hydrolase